MAASAREGNLEAPTRHPLDWQNPEFYDEEALFKELERVFDICHGCRRCVSLCQSFPMLFDLVDASATMEVDGVAKADYWQGRRPLLPLRPLLHDQVPVCAAARWNLDFPAPDAARQGGQIPEGRRPAARPDPDQHRRCRSLRRHPGRGADGECGQQASLSRARCSTGRRRDPCRAWLPEFAQHSAAQPPAGACPSDTAGDRPEAPREKSRCSPPVT